MGLIFVTPTVATAPLPGPEPHVPPGGIVTSDAFTGGDAASVHGRQSDATLGGTARAWSAAAGGIRVVSGALAAPAAAATGIAVLPCPFADVSVQVKIAALPTTGTLVLLARAQTAVADAANSSYRVNVAVSGVLSVFRRSGGVTTSLSSNVGTVVAGDTVRLQVVGSQVRVYKNGVQVYQITDATVAAGAYAGVSTATAAGWRVDDVVVTRLA